MATLKQHIAYCNMHRVKPNNYNYLRNSKVFATQLNMCLSVGNTYLFNGASATINNYNVHNISTKYCTLFVIRNIKTNNVSFIYAPPRGLWVWVTRKTNAHLYNYCKAIAHNRG